MIGPGYDSRDSRNEVAGADVIIIDRRHEHAEIDILLEDRFPEGPGIDGMQGVGNTGRVLHRGLDQRMHDHCLVSIGHDDVEIFFRGFRIETA